MACLALASPSAAWAQAGAVTKDMQTFCVNDYKRFCGDWGLNSSGLILCMR
jgi:hypothetical protein